MNWQQVKSVQRGEIINGKYMGEYFVIIRDSTSKSRYYFIFINFAYKLIINRNAHTPLVVTKMVQSL